jgi:hypothetical protein
LCMYDVSHNRKAWLKDQAEEDRLLNPFGGNKPCDSFE